MCSSRGHRRTRVDGGDLDGGDDAHAVALAGGDRLGDAADGVVVGQRQQLDAGVGGALHDLGGGQGAVGVGGVRLQVEAWLPRWAAYAIASGVGVLARGCLSGQSGERGDAAADGAAQPTYGGVVAAGLVVQDLIARRRCRGRAAHAA